MTTEPLAPTIGHTLVSIVKWFYLAYAALAVFYIWSEYRRYKNGAVNKKRLRRTIILEGLMFVSSIAVFVLNVLAGY